MKIDRYTNRTVPFTFCGHSLRFRLSLGLFSSGGIDVGTRSLLKSLADLAGARRASRILDVGSGTGVLGVALAVACPDAHLTMIDRDALAVAFSGRNARDNGLESYTVLGGLGVDPVRQQETVGLDGKAPQSHETGAKESPESGSFDLVVSNIPAKAGEPVIEHLLRTMLSVQSDDGRVALVIVNTLSDAVISAIRRFGAEIVLEDRGKGHTVIHFSRGDVVPAVDGDFPYLRTRSTQRPAGCEYTLDTAYGLPEFDTPSYACGLAVDVLSSKTVSIDRACRVLMWHPGQGLLPCHTACRFAPSELELAGRDALELEISRRNLSAMDRKNVELRHLPSFEELDAGRPGRGGRDGSEAGYDLIVCRYEPVPGAGEEEGVVSRAADLLDRGGILLVAGASADVHRLIETARGFDRRSFSVTESRKRRGFRAVALTAR